MKNLEDFNYPENEAFKLFNITRLIKSQYEAGTPLSTDIMDNMDLFEISSKQAYVAYPEGQFMEKEESTQIANIIKFLPVEYYRNYIKKDWMEAGTNNENPLFQQLLFQKKFDFIKEYLKCDFIEPYIMSESHDYVRLVLEPLLNMAGYFSRIELNHLTQDDVISYYEVFRLALPQFQLHFNEQQKQYRGKQTFEANQWFAQYDILQGPLFRNSKQVELIETFVHYDQIFSVFEDILKQTPEAKKLFLHKKTMKEAFLHGNKKMVDYLQDIMQLMPQETHNMWCHAVSEYFKHEEEQLKYNPSKELMDNTSFIRKLWSLKNYVLKTELKIYDIGHFLISRNKTLVKKIIHDMAELQTEALVKDGLNKDDLHYACHAFERFRKEHNYELKNKHKTSYPTLDINLIYSVDRHFTEFKEPDSDKKMSIYEYMANTLLPLVEGSSKDIMVNYRKFCLDENLNKKETGDYKKPKI